MVEHGRDKPLPPTAKPIFMVPGGDLRDEQVCRALAEAIVAAMAAVPGNEHLRRDG